MIGLLSLIFSLFMISPNIKEVVDEFHNLKTKESEAVFVENYTLSSQPSILAYVCALEMKKAEYSFNPISKLIIFKRTRKKLDSLIQSNPTDVHLRYIRLVLQEKAPSVLGYNDNIEEDKVFLTNKLEILDHSDYLDLYIRKNTSL
ncbi:MAG: hypothetical protein ACI83B_000803 [Sediminicola sp.]|jgi:hypothetical protein|tara:strand:+ start:7906 stop:8343 length:438 start_codon:yes stop_codon:yes gene_type:complete